MHRTAVALTLALLLSPLVATQSSQLTVVQSGPTGEINQITDAAEIRVIFSEPMVSLGRVPARPTPPWIHIAPALEGSFRWSGTTILIFTPKAGALPFATRYTVTIDASATSASGHQLGRPYSFAFTTPTVRLFSAQWARQSARFDSSVTIALKFNQRVRTGDVLAHVTARYESHEIEIDDYSDAERARLARLDPAGLRLFTAKVAAARATGRRTDAVGLRLATDWDRKRFPPADDQVVLETISVPPPGTWLRVTVDASMPSVAGPSTPPRIQQSTVELDPVFFARRLYCRTGCNPSGYNPVTFTGEVATADFSRALSIRDVTDPSRETIVEKSASAAPAGRDTAFAHGVEDAGFERQPPARTWALGLDAALRSTDGQTLGYPWLGIAENWHESAFTSFGSGHGVWETGGGRVLPFSSRNVRSVIEWLTAIPPADLMPRILALEKTMFETMPPGDGTSARLPITVDAIQAHGLDLAPVLSKSGTGLVWAGLKGDETVPQSASLITARSTVVQVTNLGITVKDSPQSTLVFVTRLDDGRPVPGAKITIVNRENKQLWRGSTNRDGLALAPALALRPPDPWADAGDDENGRLPWDLRFLVTAEKDGDVAYVLSNWTEGIEPWEFGNAWDLWQAQDILRGSVFADRGVYRPGEDVHVKAVLRLDTPTGMRLLPAGAAVDIRTMDSRGNEVDRRTVKVNKWSSAEWTWTIPSTATLGSYAIQAAMPGAIRPEGNDLETRRPAGEWLRQVRGSFLVAAYRRPDFRVDATLTADPPEAGTTLHGTIDARYLFGGTMGGRSVKWSLFREPEYGVPAEVGARYPDDKFVFGYYPERADRADTRVAGADATLDANGRLTVASPAPRDADFAYRYRLEGDVEDVSRQHIANRAAVVVYSAPWHIGLSRPEYFADTKTGTGVDVVAVDHRGAPVAGVEVTVSLVRIQWNSVRRAEGSGFYTWDTEQIEVPAGEWKVTTEATPVHVAIPVPEGGLYRLSAVARDAAGGAARTDTMFYGLGPGYTAWQRYDHNRITLEPERKRWKPGERARVMIQSPWETATALLTVEREGIRRYERFTLTSTQQTVEVPITEADIPNVYVSVLLIRGRTSQEIGKDGDDPGKPAFRLGYAELQVEDATKQLAVKVSADRQEYRPANTAKVTVTVADALGRPSRGEVTLWAVDYGVLSLTGYRMPDVLHAVYLDKALQVMTEDSRQRLVSRRVLTPKGADEGGGGGNEGGPGGVRRDFRPLAFWLGSIETDGKGRAVKDVTLPESLTTYRIMAVAGDAASRFGSADAEIRVSKPVTLLAAFPRFLTLGDRATFGGTVTSTLATGGDAVVTIRSLDPSVLAFGETTTRTIHLEGGASAAVRFDAAARTPGAARVQMTVALGAEKDAFEASLPVSAPVAVETNAAFGDTDSATSERIAVPAGIVPSTGGLEIQLASTALVGLGEGARYLVDYPFACAEQKASSALALALAADLGNAFAMGRIAPADYRTRASSLLADLPRYQCNDGGFQYWPGGCLTGETYLTAYLLHVMHVASGLGIAPDQRVVNRALDFLEVRMRADAPRQVQWMPFWGASEAFGVKVLTEYGRNQDANLTRLIGAIDRLPVFALSYVADAMASAGTRGPRYDDVVRRISNALRVEGNQAHVEELDEDVLAWLWNSNVRATALVLEGFVRRGDDPESVARLVRWLLASRRNGRWRNTQENAVALDALVRYYKTFEAATPDMTARVTIGAGEIGVATFHGRSSAAETVRLAMPELVRRVAAGTEASLGFARTGTGRLYYTARLQFAPADPPPAADEGIHIERRYERFVEDGSSPASTTFEAGDLIRITLAITLPKERRFVAVTDAMPAGVEAVDSWFQTTASDLARDASVSSSDQSWEARYRRGGFDHIEKYDDHVALFATRLGEGTHEFSYLVRATTAGTFTAAGTTAEEMYAPEVMGRTSGTVITIK